MADIRECRGPVPSYFFLIGEPVNKPRTKEELLSKIEKGRRCWDELENMVLANPAHENLQEIGWLKDTKCYNLANTV